MSMIRLSPGLFLLGLAACTGGSGPAADATRKAVDVTHKAADTTSDAGHGAADASRKVAHATTSSVSSDGTWRPAGKAIGHCTPQEEVVFSCAVKDGKVVSVCAGPSAEQLQYRFGRPTTVRSSLPSWVKIPS